MQENKNVTFNEYTMLVDEMNKLHNETKEEIKGVKEELKGVKEEIKERFDKMDVEITEIKSMLKMVTRELFKKDVI